MAPKVSTSDKLTLFVAEKPSVARDLARILGATQREPGALRNATQVVTWCIGHVAELQEPHAYEPKWKAWRADALPMVPKAFTLRPNPNTQDHWQWLCRWLTHKQVGTVVNACDAGREGELIFRYAMELAKSRKPTRRLWLNALTDAAVKTALASMRPGKAYEALGDAARCRAEADWLVGLNATRALTIAQRQNAQASGDVLTVGRVQTPTLAMLVQREDSIDAFTPEPYWQVACQWAEASPSDAMRAQDMPEPAAAAPAESFATLYTHPVQEQGRTVMSHKLTTRSAAEKIVATVQQQAGNVERLVQRVEHQPPPLLYDLTGLQRQANLRHGLTAAATLEAAQALYERYKLITYPRTDSHYLPSTLAPGLPALLRRLVQGPYGQYVTPLVASPPAWRPVALHRIVRDTEVSDHHAIIPTGTTPPPLGLDVACRQIYELVTRRFIAAFYPPAQISQGRIEIRVSGHLFVGRGRMVVDPAWHAVEPPPPSYGGDKMVPALVEQTPTQVIAAKVQDLTTRPPPRLSEAALLAAMERAGAALDGKELQLALKDAGLGTPATRAAMIETLKRRSYVLSTHKTLQPTPAGRALLAALPVEALKSAQLTGEWEAKLNQVAKGTLSRHEFMAQVTQFVQQMVHAILGQATAASAPTGPTRYLATHAHPSHACPVCGAAQKRTAQVLGCVRGRDCSFAIFNPIAGRTLTADEIGLLVQGGCTPTLAGFVSRAGKAFRAKLRLNEAGRVVFVFGEAQLQRD